MIFFDYSYSDNNRICVKANFLIYLLQNYGLIDAMVLFLASMPYLVYATRA